MASDFFGVLDISPTMSVSSSIGNNSELANLLPRLVVGVISNTQISIIKSNITAEIILALPSQMGLVADSTVLTYSRLQARLHDLLGGESIMAYNRDTGLFEKMLFIVPVQFAVVQEPTMVADGSTGQVIEAVFAMTTVFPRYVDNFVSW